MTPLQFETRNAPLWQELEIALDRAEGKKPDKKARDKNTHKVKPPPLDGARLAELYRRSCEHLALAQARAYPIHLTQRLESLTQRAHRLIYRRHDYGLARLKHLVLVDFPQSVRAHRWYLLAATLLFAVPLLAVGWATWSDPGFILQLADAQQALEYDRMYDESARALGARDGSSEWRMFGFYVLLNIGIGLQCFAGGLFLFRQNLCNTRENPDRLDGFDEIIACSLPNSLNSRFQRCMCCKDKNRHMRKVFMHLNQ